MDRFDVKRQRKHQFTPLHWLKNGFIAFDFTWNVNFSVERCPSMNERYREQKTKQNMTKDDDPFFYLDSPCRLNVGT